MAKKWQISICTRHYPLFVFTLSVGVWLVMVFGLFYADHKILEHKSSILREKYHELRIGMTESELIKIIGQPQYKRIVHVNDEPFLADDFYVYFYVIPFHIELNNPSVVEYAYCARDFLGNFDYTYEVYLDRQCKFVVYIDPPNIFKLPGIIESFTPRLIRWGILIIITGIVWLSVRLWCRKKVLKPRS